MLVGVIPCSVWRLHAFFEEKQAVCHNFHAVRVFMNCYKGSALCHNLHLKRFSERASFVSQFLKELFKIKDYFTFCFHQTLPRTLRQVVLVLHPDPNRVSTLH